MSVHALNRSTLLLPEFVKIMHRRVKPKDCRRDWIGKLRTDMAAADDPSNDSAQRILAEICRLCPLDCPMKPKP